MSNAVKLNHEVHSPDLAENGTIVLIGSLGATLKMWTPQIASFSDAHQVIAVDVRGHGASPAPKGPYTASSLADDVIAVLDSHAVPKAHIVGLSLGGAIAQTIALEHADRVATLTLVSTAPRFGEAETWTDKAELVRSKGTSALADTVVGNWFTDQCFAVNPELPESFAQTIRDINDEGYAGCCEALSNFDSREQLSAISVPTLVVAGEQDTSTKLEVVHSLHDKIPNSSMATFSPAKHLVNIEQSALFNATVLAHVAAM